MHIPQSREEFEEFLGAGVFTVVFQKQNGERRTLHCTTQREFWPANYRHQGIKEYNPEVVPCIDVELGQWRSFRIDSVLEFKEFAE